MACPTKLMCLRVVVVVVVVAEKAEAEDWEEMKFVATLVHHAKMKKM
jgi:hypothetical protein